MLDLLAFQNDRSARPAAGIFRRHRALRGLFVIGSTALLAFLVLAGPVQADGPVLTLETQTAVAAGITPGGSAVLFTLGRGFNGFLPYQIRRAEVVNDDDKDGEVRLEASFPIP